MPCLELNINVNDIQLHYGLLSINSEGAACYDRYEI